MYFALRRRQAAMPVFRRRCWSLGYPGRESPAGITSWRTRRMARHKRNVSDLPYAAPPLSCVAFFFKVQKTEIYKEERGGTLCVYFSVLKDRTARMSFACSRSRKSSSMP